MNVFLKIPYPSIDKAKNDVKFGYALFNAYAGIVSEFSASATYSYQSFLLSEEISKIFENISIVEMRHLEILSTLIKKTGLVPYYIHYDNMNPIPWNSDFIDYDTNYINMLKNNINNEKKAINEYNRLIQQSNDYETKKMLERIILDEKNHINIFTSLLDKVAK